MTRKVVLLIFTLIGFYYCFRFGYIWTAYGHGGQILGIPFAIIMLITTIKYFVTKTNYAKEKVYSFGVVNFFTLAAFSVTIEIIRNNMTDYFSFLYYEPGGYVNKIFLGWLLLGLMVLIIIFRRIKRRKLEDSNS
jgi:ABC-type polysaccharide/polyol phosphate export permease